MAVSKRLRYEVLRRDGHTCKYCGQAAPNVKLTVDHVVPTTLGGSDDPSNLVTACVDCNSGKSATPPDAAVTAQVADDAARWSQALQVVARNRSEERQRLRAACDEFRAYWVKLFDEWHDTLCFHHAPDYCPFKMPSDWRQTIDQLLGSGLELGDLVEAADLAFGRRFHVTCRWRYFCGTAWGMLRKRQEQVSALVKASAAEEDGDDRFPIMEFADVVLEYTLEAMGADERIVKTARRALWDGLSETDQIWRRVHPHYADVAVEVTPDGERLSQYETAHDFLTSRIAYDMHQIGLLRREGVQSGS